MLPAPTAPRFDPRVIVTCMKRRFTGVSGTVNALLPVLPGMVDVAYVGADLPGVAPAEARYPHAFRRMGLWQAVRASMRRRADGARRTWHVRRNHELLLAVLLRDVLRLPIRVLFTSAAIRRHSLLPRLLIARADAVIATTPAAAALVPHVVATVAHGVDTARFRPAEDRAAAWRAAGLPGEHGILVAGRVREEKGVHVFVDAMIRLLPRHPGWTAVIAGRVKPEDRAFADALRTRAAEAGLAGRIRFEGEVDAADMPAWYARCLITVACPLYEGFGLTVIEAMAAGCAVVATRTGAFESMVVPGETGTLVAPGSADELAAALEPMLADPHRTAAMGARGRARACARFSIEAEARGIAAAIERLR